MRDWHIHKIFIECRSLPEALTGILLKIELNGNNANFQQNFYLRIPAQKKLTCVHHCHSGQETEISKYRENIIFLFEYSAKKLP